MQKNKKNSNKNVFEEGVSKIIDDTMKNLKNIVDVNTVLGAPVTSPDGTIIIPVSKIIVGFVSGGGEFSVTNSKAQAPTFPFAGGSGSGFTLVPLGFLVGREQNYRFVSTDNGAYNDLINLTNSLLNTVIEEIKKK